MDKADAQPTPRTDALAKKFARNRDNNEFWDEAFSLLDDLERALAQKDAELAAANESIDRVQSLHRELMMEADRRVEAAEDGLKQERAAREQVELKHQVACNTIERMKRNDAVVEAEFHARERMHNSTKESLAAVEALLRSIPASYLNDRLNEAIAKMFAGKEKP